MLARPMVVRMSPVELQMIINAIYHYRQHLMRPGTAPISIDDNKRTRHFKELRARLVMRLQKHTPENNEPTNKSTQLEYIRWELDDIAKRLDQYFPKEPAISTPVKQTAKTLSRLIQASTTIAEDVEP